MRTTGLNFRHLYFFRMVAAEGSVTRAADKLGLAIQTVSTQIAALEQSIGKSLLTQQGRRLVPTEAGRVALTYAEQIFQLGDRMQEALEEVDTGKIRLSVGISDSMPKLIAAHYLQAALPPDQPVRLVCTEGEFDVLLAELALHKLDVVLTDREVRAGTTLKVFSHQLFDSEMVVVGTPALAQRYGGAGDGFPQNLNGAPFLLPARNNALRGKLDEWFVQHHVRPDVVGEFEDNALLNTFGRRGLGLFFAPAALADDVAEQFGAVRVGSVPSVREQFYMISSDRKIMHPAVEAILAASQKGVPVTA